MSIGPMLHVKFKKRTGHPVDFRGHWPGGATQVHTGRDVRTQIRREWVFFQLHGNERNGYISIQNGSHIGLVIQYEPYFQL